MEPCRAKQAVVRAGPGGSAPRHPVSAYKGAVEGDAATGEMRARAGGHGSVSLGDN